MPCCRVQVTIDMTKTSDFPVIANSSREVRPRTRREILRQILAGVGAAVVGPCLAQAHPMHKYLAHPESLQDASEKAAVSDWSPTHLDAHQSGVLTALAEGIVPGSSKAQVNRIIDVLLAVETPENQRTFAASLAAIEAEAKKRYSHDVPNLSAMQRDQLLAACASQEPKNPAKHDDAFPDWKANQNIPNQGPANVRDHFEHIKGWVVATYYSSEEGMRELGWTDEFYFEMPPECSPARDIDLSNRDSES
jgi:gluconate 2-dehydrogenase subunit 3-like protein